MQMPVHSCTEVELHDYAYMCMRMYRERERYHVQSIQIISYNYILFQLYTFIRCMSSRMRNQPNGQASEYGECLRCHRHGRLHTLETHAECLVWIKGSQGENLSGGHQM
jgi:hypothetical protein